MEDPKPVELAVHPDIAQAREDPRLSRENARAVVADFFEAVEEAERSHFLATLGVQALLAACDEQLGAEAPEDGDIAPDLEAVRERRELAAAEIDNDFPYQHAALAISLLFALDALVEQLAPSARDIAIEATARNAMKTALQQVDDDLTQEQLKAIEDAARALLSEAAANVPKMFGGDIDRWERLLASVGLGADPARPLPNSLQTTLAELIHARHVIAHRAGRVDDRARAAIPRVDEGQLMRIGRDDVRRYDAAVRAYASEILSRLGVAESPNLHEWQQFHHLWV